MNLGELERKLSDANVPPDAYCLTGGLPNEALCIEQRKDGTWRTYYSERGGRSNPRVFNTEGEACEFFLKEILRWDI